jgi:hypothetical protein
MRALAITLAVVIAGCASSAEPQTQTPTLAPDPTTPGGGVVVTYQPSQVVPQLGEWFATSHVLETARDLIGAAVRLDQRVDLVATDCGRVNAYYDPHTRTVILCHELIAVIASSFDNHDYLPQVCLYVAMHELGHALIDVLDLPVVGREEDAADQFATLFFVNPGDLRFVVGVVQAAQFFRRADADQTVFWDSHSFGEARYYQLLCMVYGGAPDARDAIASALPPRRAEQCSTEYQQVRHGWNRLVAPHRGTNRGPLFVE